MVNYYWRNINVIYNYLRAATNEFVFYANICEKKLHGLKNKCFRSNSKYQIHYIEKKPLEYVMELHIIAMNGIKQRRI